MFLILFDRFIARLCFRVERLLSASCQLPREGPEKTASSLRTLSLGGRLLSDVGVAGAGVFPSAGLDSVEAVSAEEDSEGVDDAKFDEAESDSTCSCFSRAASVSV